MILLWHHQQPIGICLFTAPQARLGLRWRAFGLPTAPGRLALEALNRQLWTLARVVLHPSYRGAGLAARFIDHACRCCPVDWIEALSAMGHAHPLFERAGFQRLGVIRKGVVPWRSRRRAALGDVRRFSQPVYYLRDNRCRDNSDLDNGNGEG